MPLFLLRKRHNRSYLSLTPLFPTRHRPSLPILAFKAQLSEPGRCPRNQEHPYPDHDNPHGSRDALTVRCEPFGSYCCRDKHHHPQIHNADREEDRRKASAAVSAVEAEAQPVSPSRGSICGQRRLGSQWLPAAGKVMRFPRAELERAGDHDDNTDRDRNNARQRGLLHLDLRQGRTKK